MKGDMGAIALANSDLAGLKHIILWKCITVQSLEFGKMENNHNGKDSTIIVIVLSMAVFVLNTADHALSLCCKCAYYFLWGTYVLKRDPLPS
jgi:hypothetical protein